MALVERKPMGLISNSLDFTTKKAQQEVQAKSEYQLENPKPNLIQRMLEKNKKRIELEQKQARFNREFDAVFVHQNYTK